MFRHAELSGQGHAECAGHNQYHENVDNTSSETVRKVACICLFGTGTDNFAYLLINSGINTASLSLLATFRDHLLIIATAAIVEAGTCLSNNPLLCRRRHMQGT